MTKYLKKQKLCQNKNINHPEFFNKIGQNLIVINKIQINNIFKNLEIKIIHKKITK